MQIGKVFLTFAKLVPSSPKSACGCSGPSYQVLHEASLHLPGNSIVGHCLLPTTIVRFLTLSYDVDVSWFHIIPSCSFRISSGFLVTAAVDIESGCDVDVFKVSEKKAFV